LWAYFEANKATIGTCLILEDILSKISREFLQSRGYLYSENCRYGNGVDSKDISGTKEREMSLAFFDTI